MEMLLYLWKRFLRSFYLDKVREKLNMIDVEELLKEW